MEEYLKKDYHDYNKKKYRSFSLIPWKEEHDIPEMIREVLLLWIGIVCIIGWLGDFCDLTFSRCAVFTCSLFLVLLMELLFEKMSREYDRGIYAAYVLLPLIFLLSATIQKGIAGLFHDAALCLAKRGVHLFYQGSYVEVSLGKTLFMILLSSWILFLIKILREKTKLPIFLLLIGILLLEMRLGDGSNVTWLCLMFFWILLSIISNMRAYTFLFVPLFLFTLLFLAIFGISSGNGWKNVWQSVRYHQNNKVLPDGDLTQAASVKRSDKTAIVLETNQKDYYYLKGFVGTVYHDNSWHETDQTLDDFEIGIVGGTSEFLSWFHEKGFSGWNELADRSGQSDESKEISITIHNKRANRHYLYLPYELTSSVAQIQSQGIGVLTSGESLYSTGLFGKKNYRIKSAAALYDTQLTGNDGEEEVIQKIYKAYEEYVNRTCLTLPKEVKETLRDSLKGEKTVGVDDTLALVKKVRKWISDYVVYDENPGAVPQNEEFTSWFLHKNTHGYDVQCATIAVMMFRYYGLPSRYVEGYLVEKNNTIPEKSAHAWAEIYLTGCGWVPVEVMDTYQKRMPSYLEEDGGTIYSKASQFDTSQEDAANKESQSQSQDKKEEEKEQQKKNTVSGLEEDDSGILSVLLFISLILIILLLLLALFTLLVFRLKEFIYHRRATESISAERSIAMWYQYCIWILYELEEDPLEKAAMAVDNRMFRWEERWQLRHPEVSRKTLRQVGLLRQKAIYRKKGIEWEETSAAIHFFKNEYRYLYKKLDFAGKCRVRLGIRPAFLKKM